MTTGPKKCSLVCYWIFVSIARVGTAATLSEAIDAFEIATGRIRTYDVYVTARHEGYLKVVGDRFNISKSRQPPKVRRLAPGESPYRLTNVTRQVCSIDGKRRFETFQPTQRRLSSAGVFDGEIVRSLNLQNGPRGTIKQGTPYSTRFAVGLGDEYNTLFRDFRVSGTYSEILRSRSQAKVILEDDAVHGSLVTIEAPIEGHSDNRIVHHESIGFRISLDPQHGMMPVLIEHFTRDNVHRMEIQRFHEPQPGVWVPIEATCYARSTNTQELNSKASIVVDVNRSKWNRELPQDTFVLQFPPGTTVVDETRQIHFIAGQGDSGTHIDTLLANATKVVALNRDNSANAAHAQRTGTWTWTRLLLMLVSFVVLASIAWYRWKVHHS